MFKWEMKKSDFSFMKFNKFPGICMNEPIPFIEFLEIKDDINMRIFA